MVGFFAKKGLYELGVYTNKVKNGVFLDITADTIWIRRYSNGVKYGEEFRLDLPKFTLTHIMSGSGKKYSLNDVY